MRRGQAGLLVKRCDYLSASDKAVFLALLETADNATCLVPDKMAPTLDTLTRWTSLSRRTVQRATAHLELHGWAAVTRGQGRGIRSRYALVPREPDLSCSCEKVSRRHPLPIRKGVTEDEKRCHERPEKVSRGPESPQVNTGIARREKEGPGRGRVVVLLRTCDRCDSTETQLIGAYRLCREHAGPRWKDES